MAVTMDLMTERDEIDAMVQEFKWLIDEEVEIVIRKVHGILNDCCKRFAVPNPDYTANENLVKPEKFMMSSSNGAPIKCMVTLMGDIICEADMSINFQKQNLQIRSAIQPSEPWRLQQIQDAGNHLCQAIHHIHSRDNGYIFQSGQELLMFLDEIISSLRQGRRCLLLPKKKTLTDLVHNRYMKCLSPAVPSDAVLSFYIQAQKLILAVYQLTPNQNNHYEIGARHQTECAVPWLNDTLIFFTVALQMCQQLRDKVRLFVNEDIMESEDDSISSLMDTSCSEIDEVGDIL